MSLVAWLWERQRELGLSDQRFAPFIGLDVGAWNRLRRGKAGLTLRTAKRAVRAFPEHRETIKELAFADGERCVA